MIRPRLATQAVVGFAATYLLAAHLFKVPEARALMRWLVETWRRRGT